MSDQTRPGPEPLWGGVEPIFYILGGDDGVTPVPCEDIFCWAEWQARPSGRGDLPNNQVAWTGLGPGYVSTIFTGINSVLSVFRPGPPLLFETMVFLRGGKAIDCRRYTSWAEAVEGHKQVVEAYRRKWAAGDK